MSDRGLNLHLDDCLINEEEIKKYYGRLWEIKQRLISGNEKLTGWVRLPLEQDKKEVARIKEVAERIGRQCQVLVIVGIGGSYLGIRAGIEMLKKGGQAPEICFAGNNLSGTYHAELLEYLSDKDFSICAISKSGTTTETGIAFSILKNFLIHQVGKEEAVKRIYVITDRFKGLLREEADRKGYESFLIPEDVGGRYSVLTAVGLLPIAAVGIDINPILEGAADEADKFLQDSKYDAAALLAAVRNELFLQGKFVEVFEYYEPRFHFMIEWLKQLFGESEGKAGKGILPVGMQFSTDLHSMGQFLQEGNQIFFETVLNVIRPEKDIAIPAGFPGIPQGMSMNKVNRAALEGAMEAHRNSAIPMIKIDIPEISPYYFGRTVYFFKCACAISAYLMGVNPFDQPGVEKYKSEMRNILIIGQ